MTAGLAANFSQFPMFGRWTLDAERASYGADSLVCGEFSPVRRLQAFSPEHPRERHVFEKAIRELQAENDALYEALRNAEERAIAGQLALETMHEIRNPLEALGNLTFLTQQEAEDPERVRQYMSLAEEQIRNGSRVASKTLAFARSSRVLQRADLVGVAEAALRIHQPTIQSKKVRLVKCLPEELVGEVHVGELLRERCLT